MLSTPNKGCDLNICTVPSASASKDRGEKGVLER